MEIFPLEYHFRKIKKENPLIFYQMENNKRSLTMGVENDKNLESRIYENMINLWKN